MAAQNLATQLGELQGIADCAVVAVVSRSAVEVELEDGRVLTARCPQHISIEWLAAALEIAPVAAIVAGSNELRPTLWGIFPEPRHDAVRLAVQMRVESLSIDSAERVRIACGRSRIELAQSGEVVVRGRELLSRASEVNRIKGARVRIN